MGLEKEPLLPLPHDLKRGAHKFPSQRTTRAPLSPSSRARGSPQRRGKQVPQPASPPHAACYPPPPPTTRKGEPRPSQAAKRGRKSHPLPVPGRQQTPVGWVSQPGSPKEGWGRRVPAPKPNKARPEPQPGRIAQPRLFLPGQAGPRPGPGEHCGTVGLLTTFSFP